MDSLVIKSISPEGDKANSEEPQNKAETVDDSLQSPHVDQKPPPFEYLNESMVLCSDALRRHEEVSMFGDTIS